MTQEEKIKALKDLGYEVEIIDGNPTILKNVDLSFTNIKELPDNLVVSGDLDLSGTKIESLPKNLVVGKTLFLNDTKIESLPENLVVGSGLYLRYTKIKSLPENLIVGGWLDLSGTEITSIPENLVVGDSLILYDAKIKSLPDNFIVGGSLFLNNTDIKSLPNNLVVGGYLDLSSTKIESLPDNLVVIDYIYKRNGDVICVERNHNIDFVERLWGDKPYCKVDGIFTEVVKRRGKVWTVRKVGETETFYLVNDGNGHYAHGETVKAAKADLIYKTTSKDKSEYEGLTLESVLTHEEAIKCYRTITGACSFGTKNFVESVLSPDERKDQYTIAEIIRLTKDQYGNETFSNFFKK